MIEQRAQYVRDLETVDWEFPVQFPGISQILHWYPASFRPEIPATLIEAFTKPDDVVFDPYGGAGTTGAEAIRAGRRALITESNLIGVGSGYALVGLLLLKAFDQPLLHQALSMLETFVSAPTEPLSMLALHSADKKLQRLLDDRIDDFMHPSSAAFLSAFRAGPPKWTLLEPWFEQKTLEQVKGAVDSAEAQEGAFCRLIGFIAISAVLRACSSQTKSWGHIADNVKPRDFAEKNLTKHMRNWLGRVRGMLQKVEIAQGIRTQMPRAMVIRHDWAEKLAVSNSLEAQAHLLVTSPPYANAIDYTLSQRLSHYLFGHSDEMLSALVQREIGARRKRFASLSKHSWSEDLVAALTRQIKHVRPDGYVAFILPHQDTGRDIGTTNMTETMGQLGWVEAFQVDRSIRQSRTRQSWTSITKETVHVFSSGG